VVRKVLSGLASQHGLEQREAIFHSRCTIEGKVCDLIIDEEIVLMLLPILWWLNSNLRFSPILTIDSSMA